MIDYAYLIPVLPIIGFILELFLGKYTWKRGGLFANLTLTGSVFISVGTLMEVLGGLTLDKSVEWFFPGMVVGVLIDPLSISMLCMVSFVGLLIHIYATEYMDEDPNKNIYFAETALFTGSMLGLVLSNNFLQLFIFYELVGLCSYLLIGFWWYKPEAAAAAKKAFLMTKVADVLFVVGLLMLYRETHSLIPEPLTFKYIFEILPEIAPQTLTVITILIFMGAVGKSSQFPLHSWIPDAMEGPTTVSALIHAATMVTAGVYLVARSFPIFLAAPHALTVVAIVGGFTALFAATMGLVVNDIKRVLAYSTISQLGYMTCMLGLGSVIGAAAVGYSLLHLISHAFFKALLFLGAGSVLHGLHDVRGIKEMGGLLKRMPITGYTMLIGSLALVGFPLTSGFFSKDRIIESAYEYALATQHAGGNVIVAYLPWLFVLLGVILTATYTFRMWFLAFTGKPRTYLAEHAHEAKGTMTVPLMVLSLFALFFGILTQGRFYKFLEGNFEPVADMEHLAELGGTVGVMHAVHGLHVPAGVIYLPTLLVLLGIATAGHFYYNNRRDVGKYVKSSNPVYKLLWNKYYIDYIYKDIICSRVVLTVAAATDIFDLHAIDGVINGMARVTAWAGRLLRKVQTGIVQDYATATVLGVSLLLIVVKVWGG